MALVLALSATACTEAKLDEPPGSRSSAVPASTVPASVVTVDDSPLRGMRGAVPSVRVPSSFRDQVLAADPGATDMTAAAAGYDAIVLLASAAEAARSDAPGRVADGVIAASTRGRTCTSFARCRTSALAATDFDYDGLSGNIELLANGDPGEADYAVVEYDSHGRLRTTERLSVQAPPLAGVPPAADAAYGPPGDGVLTVGTLLPVLGPDGDAARGALAGAKVAVADINDHGGVLGDDMVLVPDESGDGSPPAIHAATAKLLSGRDDPDDAVPPIDAVLGATVYSETAAALPALADAGIPLISPTDTARALSVAADRGLFFRTAPSTDLEGQVLGDVITDDGYTKVAIVAGPDEDDKDLASDVAAALNGASATVTATVTISGTDDVDAVAQQVLDSGPQAILLATPADRAAALIRALVVKGKGPATLPTYGTSSNMTPELVARASG